MKIIETIKNFIDEATELKFTKEFSIKRISQMTLLTVALVFVACIHCVVSTVTFALAVAKFAAISAPWAVGGSVLVAGMVLGSTTLMIVALPIAVLCIMLKKYDEETIVL